MGHLRVALSFQTGAGCGPVARPHFYRAWENTMATRTLTPPAEVLIARDSFVLEYEGAPVSIVGGVTRVRSGHPMLKGVEHLFEPMTVHYDIEQATAAPGEKRGQ